MCNVFGCHGLFWIVKWLCMLSCMVLLIGRVLWWCMCIVYLYGKVCCDVDWVNGWDNFMMLYFGMFVWKCMYVVRYETWDMLEYVNALNVELILTATVLQVLMQGHGQGFGMVLECKLGHEGMVHDMKYLAILEV